uniref:Protein kinase C n=1 Tax=Caenorhabditis japonica TaxID=281687 RepID=A0A8R1DIZ1_CAEJA
MLNWERRESEKRLNNIDDLIRVNLNTAPRYNLSTCVVQKSMSTVMTSMFCYLRDEKKFVANNRDLLRDWKIVRFCMFKNEFRNLGRLFKKFKVKPSNNSWTHIMMVRHPVERFVSGFVDKCYRKPVVQKHCNGCRQNLTCFMESEYQRMQNQVANGSFLRTFEDRHFFPQNWRCNLHEYFNKFTFIPYSSSPNYSVTSQLFPIFRAHGVPESSLSYIETALSSGRTAHSTVSSKATAFIEKRLTSSPYLMELLVKMFYHDFVLFNFTLPVL